MRKRWAFKDTLESSSTSYDDFRLCRGDESSVDLRDGLEFSELDGANDFANSLGMVVKDELLGTPGKDDVSLSMLAQLSDIDLGLTENLFAKKGWGVEGSTVG